MLEGWIFGVLRLWGALESWAFGYLGLKGFRVLGFWSSGLSGQLGTRLGFRNSKPEIRTGQPEIPIHESKTSNRIFRTLMRKVGERLSTDVFVGGWLVGCGLVGQNLLTVVEKETPNSFGGVTFLGFEPLTFFPIQVRK